MQNNIEDWENCLLEIKEENWGHFNKVTLRNEDKGTSSHFNYLRGQQDEIYSENVSLSATKTFMDQLSRK